MKFKAEKKMKKTKKQKRFARIIKSMKKCEKLYLKVFGCRETFDQTFKRVFV